MLYDYLELESDKVKICKEPTFTNFKGYYNYEQRSWGKFCSFQFKPGREGDFIRWIKSIGDSDRNNYIREALSWPGESKSGSKPSPPKLTVERRKTDNDIEVNLYNWF